MTTNHAFLRDIIVSYLAFLAPGTPEPNIFSLTLEIPFFTWKSLLIFCLRQQLHQKYEYLYWTENNTNGKV